MHHQGLARMLHFGIFFLVLISSSALFAQEENDDLSQEMVLEITVTAEKREDTLKEVPVSVDVVDARKLEESGAQTIKDIQDMVPALQVSTNASYAQPYIRGVGSDLASIGTESSVAVYVDGVYRPRPTSGILDLYDLERVEVLKGPQGTLYGRNATGGAINVVSAEPEAALRGRGDLTLGTDGLWRVRGMLNTPIVENAMLGRFSVLASESDGYIEELNSGQPVDQLDLQAVKGQLLSIASGNFSARFSFDYSRDDGTRNLAPKLDARDQGLAVDLGAREPSGERDVRYSTVPTSELKQWSLSAHLSWEFENFDLVSITGLHDEDLQNELDVDATELNIFSTRTWLDSEVFSQEFQLVSDIDGPTKWTAGLFYMQEDASQMVDIDIPILNPPDVTEPLLRPEATNKVTAYAVYGQVNHRIREDLELYGGLRYSYEEKDHSLELISLGSSLAVFPDKDDWDAITPRIGIKYAVNDAARLYFNVSRGFKSGGFNSADTDGSVDAFDPEYLWSYEGGLKAVLPDQRLRVNVAGFYYDYRDLQVNYFGPESIATIDNAAKARISGVDLDLAAQPIDQLQIDYSVQILNAEYQDYIFDENTDLSGNRMPRAPKVSTYLGLRYNQALDSGRLVYSAAYRYQSEIFFDQFESELIREDDYSVVDARISYEASRWHLGIYGRNIGDENYAHNAISVPGLTGTLRFLEEPANYGLELGFRL